VKEFATWLRWVSRPGGGPLSTLLRTGTTSPATVHEKDRKRRRFVEDDDAPVPTPPPLPPMTRKGITDIMVTQSVVPGSRLATCTCDRGLFVTLSGLQRQESRTINALKLHINGAHSIGTLVAKAELGVLGRRRNMGTRAALVKCADQIYGFTPAGEQLDAVCNMLHQQQTLFVLTGPAGSGKSTTIQLVRLIGWGHSCAYTPPPSPIWQNYPWLYLYMKPPCWLHTHT
jgi:hypothetical protein